MQKQRKLVVANWKMNPDTSLEAKKLFTAIRLTARSLKNTDVLVCSPFIYLNSIAKLDRPKHVYLGVQNIAELEKGAQTGEVSATMVKNEGATYTIIGHSERRAIGETDESVSKKINLAFVNNLRPIVCVGERIRDKEGEHLTFLREQIKASLAGLSKRQLLDLVIAYEPVWAIGKSYQDSMNPTDIHEMTLFIQKVLSELFGKDMAKAPTLLYGGSVEVENTKAILDYGNVDGFLVGHASLVPLEFGRILELVDRR